MGSQTVPFYRQFLFAERPLSKAIYFCRPCTFVYRALSQAVHAYLYVTLHVNSPFSQYACMLEFGFSAGGRSRDGKMESHVWHTNMVSLNRFWNMLYLTFHGLDRVKSLESLHSREVILTQRSYEFSADFWFDAGLHQSEASKASYTGIYGNYMEHVLEMKDSCLLLLLICFFSLHRPIYKVFVSLF